MPKVFPELKSASCIRKLEKPILTSADMPYDSMLVFNAGVTKFNGKYIMVFRNDYGTTPERYYETGGIPATSIGVAISDNGIDGWQVRKEFLIDSYKVQAETGREYRRFYDPRIAVIDGKPYLTMAIDARHGIYGCIAEVDDNFEKINVISTTVPNNRNMVLFPEKTGGYFHRLERPMAMFGEHSVNYDVWCSRSPDLVYWGNSKLVLDMKHVTWCNDKIGPAAPPIKTEKGWLTTFHAVDYDLERGKNGWERQWQCRYTAGIMLLDLEDPTKRIAMYDKPLIAPDVPFETDEGFRHNVIFPGGMILEDDGEVKIYYGSADCVECVCTANVDDLIKLCLEGDGE